MSQSIATPAQTQTASRRLGEADAIDIWLARWMRIRRKDILARYGCDPRRLYEVWEGVTFPQSRGKALQIVTERYPWLTDRVDFGPHKRIGRAIDPAQMTLFD